MVGKYNKKGGSKASDLVMSTNPVLCNQESPVMPGEPIQANMEDLTLYRTTGGGRKQSNGAPGCCGHLPQSGGKKRKSNKKRKWSLKYKRSINCKKPKGFSQRQYCKRINKTKKIKNRLKK